MNKEKISDFVDVWAETVGLKETRYINVIKNDILKRCAMYEKEISTISTKDDSCDSYIIKPVNESYSLEDFFLNRLMLGLRKIDGVKISSFKNKFGVNPIMKFKDELNKLVHEKLIEIDLDEIRLTNKGIDLANIVWERFV